MSSTETNLYEDLRARLLLSGLARGLSIDEAIAAGERAIGWTRNGTTLALLPAPTPIATAEPVKLQAEAPAVRTRKRVLAIRPETAFAETAAPRTGWTPERIATFKRLWAEGAAVADIASELNVSVASVYTKRHEMGLPKRAPSGPQPTGTPRHRADAPPRLAPAKPARNGPVLAPTNLPAAPKGDSAFEDVESAETVLRWIKQRGFVADRDGAGWRIERQVYDRGGLIAFANRHRVSAKMTPFRYVGPTD